MIRFAFCEDNSYQRDLISEIINDYISDKFASITLDVFESGNDLLADIEENGAYDVYLLDIMMPKITGMKVAETIRSGDKNGKIIFLTATRDYLLESYDVKATHYLLKPIDVDKLYALFDEIIGELSKKTNLAVTIKGKDGFAKIRVSDILYINKSDRCLDFHLANGKTIESHCIRSSFASAVEEFVRDYDFVIISAGECVNAEAVRSYKNNEITLTNGEKIFPSKSKQKTLTAVFQ